MFILTREKDNIESGAFASPNEEGTPVVQFFVNKDDAITYNTHLEAIGQDLEVTETDNDAVDKLCSLMGYAYTVIEPGEIVLPRDETLYHDYLSRTDIP
jgi:hypothetical protein